MYTAKITLREPAISGITAVVSADSAVRNAADSLPACKRRCQLAATNGPAQLTRSPHHSVL